MFLTEKQVLQPSSSVISSGCCNIVLYSSWWGSADCVAGGAQQVSWCEFRGGPSGVGVCRPRFVRPVGRRTCSIGLLSYSEPGAGRPPFRGGFSPLLQTGSHWAGGIPPVFGNVKDRILLPSPPTVLTLKLILYHRKDAGLEEYSCHLTLINYGSKKFTSHFCPSFGFTDSCWLSSTVYIYRFYSLWV